MRTPFFIIFAAVFAPMPVHAHSTNACFSPAELVAMVEKREAVSKGASDCLKQYWETHKEFFRRNRYSKYYGNRNTSIDNPDKRKKVLLRVLWRDFERTLNPDEVRAFRAAVKLSDFDRYYQQRNPQGFAAYQRAIAPLQLDQRAAEESGGADVLRPNSGISLQNISCVDMTRRCLGEGFKKAGMFETWKKIDKEVRANDVSGVEMQKALSDLGWKILYWNPDPNNNAAWDNEDKQIAPLPVAAACTPTADKPCPKPKTWNGAWGGHTSRYKRVMERDEYYLGSERPIRVDDKKLLVGFGTNPPAAFASVPFFVGTAHSGYHVFPGFYGNIIEAHSMRELTGFDNLQVSKFNPLAQGQGQGGGPVWTNSERYRSGVIAIPPGYLETNPVSALRQPQMDGECADIHPVPKAAAPAPAPAPAPSEAGSAVVAPKP